MAQRCLGMPLISSAFGLDRVALLPGRVTKLALGHRVDFQQASVLTDIEDDIAIKGGAISVFIDLSGHIFSITSSLKRGRKPKSAGLIISPKSAIQLAGIRFKLPVSAAACDLVLASHKDKIQVAYEITLESNNPREIMSYVVLAKSGEIVDTQFKLLKCCVSNTSITASEVLANALLCTPDAFKPISTQMSKAIIERLSDPSILANEYFAMFVGAKPQAVRAKADGTYCYGVNDSEFAAVSVWIALNRQLAVYLSLGMKPPSLQMPVYVDDARVKNNAYFDPSRY
jgi:hypothetical protein